MAICWSRGGKTNRCNEAHCHVFLYSINISHPYCIHQRNKGLPSKGAHSIIRKVGTNNLHFYFDASYACRRELYRELPLFHNRWRLFIFTNMFCFTSLLFFRTVHRLWIYATIRKHLLQINFWTQHRMRKFCLLLRK